MNQEINFYRGRTRPHRLPLGAGWMARASLATLLFLVLVSSIQLVMNQNLRARVTAVQQQTTVLESRLNELQLLHPEPKPNPALVAEVERTQRLVGGLNRLMQSVNRGDLLQRGGFAPFFESLARQTQPDVWLTAIEFKAGGKEIELAGVAQVSERIPTWVKSLGVEATFRAKTFSNFAIKRPEQQHGQVDFVLSTRIPEAEINAKR